MTLLNIIFMFIGFCVAVWWVIGVAIFAFATPVYVAKGAPLSSKLITVGVSGFVLPYMLLTVGQLPMAMITKKNMDPDEQADLQKWMESHCPCPNCRARRGE